MGKNHNVHEGKKQGFYLCTFDVYASGKAKTGVEAKIVAQIDTFCDAGLQCEFIECKTPSSRVRRGLGSLPFISDGIEWPDIDRFSDASFVYIRRPMYSSREFVSFLRQVKQVNPEIRIVIEIPTYPYDKEMLSPLSFFAVMKDRKYRKQWKVNVDHIADMSRNSVIFGIDTLPISNGVDLSSIEVRKPSMGESEAINVIFAAFFGPWHGVDLFVEGLQDYYASGGTRNVILHLAGGGNLIDQLSGLVKNAGMEDHVVFHGAMDRNGLDELYDKCSLAVDSLALHRRGKDALSSSLKSREYLAKGMPSVYAGNIDIFMDDKPDFVHELPSAEHPVDIQAVVKFHDDLYSRYDEEELILAIRAYAENTVSMERAMRSVIEFFKDADDDA